MILKACLAQVWIYTSYSLISDVLVLWVWSLGSTGWSLWLRWWWLTCFVVVICSSPFSVADKARNGFLLVAVAANRWLVSLLPCWRSNFDAARDNFFFSSLLLYNGCRSYRLFCCNLVSGPVLGLLDCV
ncbi:hypothetical protein QL285_076059 [Trifolium repens]|nr:hypothetical protein QL285_076059 [Trifolium repens]